MDKLLRIEQDRRIILPEIYKDFYWTCSGFTPEKLIGTDLINDHSNDLAYWAMDLLEEDEVDNFLQPDDFVFMMHQGYIFWYFKADGNDDPPVFSYSEVDRERKNCGSLSSFVKEFI